MKKKITPSIRQANKGKTGPVKKIVVVDDNTVSLEVTSRIFQKAGCEVRTAQDGIDALNLLKDYTPDIIAVDLILPYLSGDRLCRIIRNMEHLKNASLILISAAAVEAEIDLVELGVDVCLAKGAPNFVQVLLDLVKQTNKTDAARPSKKTIDHDAVIKRAATVELLTIQRRLETILQNIVEPLFEFTRDRKILYANQSAVTLAGVPEHQLFSSDFLDLFSSAHGKQIKELLESMNDTPVEIGEAEPITLNGYLITGRLIPFKVGRSRTIIAMLSDITQRKQAEKALLQSRANFYNIVKKASDGIIVTDKDGVVLFVNPMVETIFGYRAEDLLGEVFGHSVSADGSIDIDILKAGKEPGIGDVYTIETEWEGKPGFLISIKDVTEKRRAQEELKRTAQELKLTVTELKDANQKILEQQKSVIEEERLKVLLQISGATAHELNQPLTALLSNIELMRLNQKNPKQAYQFIDKIEASGRRMADIIQKIHSLRRDVTQPYSRKDSTTNLHEKMKILVVEDSDQDFQSIQAILNGYKSIILSRVTTITEAMLALKKDPFDLILLDYLLPDGDSFDILGRMKKDGMDIPVIVITGQGDEIIASRLIQAGASDYLPKAVISKESLFRSINNSLEKFRLKKEIQSATKKMAEMATKDELTGLYNRRYFMEALEREAARTRRYKNDLFLCMIDLDYFKRINDTYGHTAGDMVLSEIGMLLRKYFRESDIVCRYGGEEFACFFPNTDMKGAKFVCERFRRMVAVHQFEYNSSQFQMTVSVGIASYNAGTQQTIKELIEKADQALYQAKKTGRNKVVVAWV